MIGIIIGSLIAYMVGSIPFSQIAASLKGKDLTKLWDGNVGVTNLLKSTNSVWLTILAFIGDLSKGIFAIVMSMNIQNCFNENLNILLIFMSFFAVVGHIFSIFLKFKGGMGQSTALGAVLGINPILAAMVLMGRYIEKEFAYSMVDVKNKKSKFYANNISGILVIFILYVLIYIYDVPREAKVVFFGATAGVLIGYLKRYYYIKNDLIPVLKRRHRR